MNQTMNQAMILCAFCGLGLSIAMAELAPDVAFSASMADSGASVSAETFHGATQQTHYGAAQ